MISRTLGDSVGIESSIKILNVCYVKLLVKYRENFHVSSEGLRREVSRNWAFARKLEKLVSQRRAFAPN